MNNEIVNLLMEATNNGIAAVIENDRVIFKAPKNKTINSELVQRLKERKSDIFSFLSAENSRIAVEPAGNAIKRINRNAIDKIPLSFAQESIWLEDKYHGSRVNLISRFINFKGQLDENALSFALTEMVRRHEVFRTLIKEENGEAYQEIISHENWQIDYFDATSPDFNIKSHLDWLNKISFDLSVDFSFKAQLLKFSKDYHKLILIFNHIATDDVSEAIFVKEVVELYNSKIENRQPAIGEPEVQYADYAIWQRAFFQGEEFNQKINYWKEKLDDVLNLKIPSDFQKPTRLSVDGDTVHFEFDTELTNKINEFVNGSKVTHYVFFLSIFKILLYRFTGQNDICVGSPVANRNHSSIENVIGYFVNSIPIRTLIDGQQEYAGFLSMIRDSVLKALEYQEIPFEKIVSAINVDREMNRHPIYQVVFNALDITQSEEIQLRNVTLEKDSSFLFNKSEFEISLTTFKGFDKISVFLNFKTQLLSRETAIQLLKYFEILTKSFIENPGKKIGLINLLDDEDYVRVAINNNKTEYPIPAKYASFLDLFEERTKYDPYRTAVVFNDHLLSYKELNDKSTQFAVCLAHLGYGRGSLIPIFIDKSVEMLIGLLGILKSGAAFVAIPRDFPIERIQYILDQSETKTIVTNNSCSEGFISTIPGIRLLCVDTILQDATTDKNINPEVKINGNDLAYIIYTSGSTGNPKAVMIQHNSLLNFLYPFIEMSQANEDSIFLGLFSYAFDGSCIELYMPLMCGGKVVIAPDEAKTDGFLLKELIEANHLTHLLATPSTYKILLNAGWKNEKNIKLIVSAEPLKESLVNELLLSDEQTILNIYGPTEVTLCGTYKFVKRNELVTVGKPLPNYQVYVVDDYNNLCPPGIAGEILIGGIGVGKGYFKLPQLTDEKFIDNLFDKKSPYKLYRTGDVGRWMYNDELEVLGRKDNQLKIRGFRIELDEIEQTLNKVQGIRSARALVANGFNEDVKQIIAFVIPDDGYDKKNAFAKIREYLPHYMMPSEIISVTDFPLSRNGKIDTKALLNLMYTNSSSADEAEPATDTEKEILSIWKRLFNSDKISLTDDFFRIGGNSILAVRLVANIKNQMNILFPLDSIFEFPTVRALSAKLDEMLEEITPAGEELLLKINDRGNHTPVFVAPGVGGSSIEFKNIFDGLSSDQPFYGFSGRGLNGINKPFATVEEASEAYVKKIKSVYPGKTIHIGGYSFGGKVAFEMVHQLEHSGYNVDTLFIFDSISPWTSTVNHSALYNLNYKEWIVFFYNLYFRAHNNAEIKNPLKESNLDGLPPSEQLKMLYNIIAESGGEYTFNQLKGFTEVYRTNAAMDYYANGKKVKARIVLFKSELQHDSLMAEEKANLIEELNIGKKGLFDYGWNEFTTNEVIVHSLKCTHLDLLTNSFAFEISQLMKKYL